MDNITTSVEWHNGKTTEADVIKRLSANPELLGDRVVAVFDCTDDREMQNIGIDCIMCLEDGQCYGLDVKADKYIGKVGAYDTKNVLVEWTCKYTSTGKVSPGWGKYSKAKYILFVNPEDEWFLLDLPLTQEFIKANPKLLKRMTTAHPKGVSNKVMYNIMVPMEDVLNYCLWDKRFGVGNEK